MPGEVVEDLLAVCRAAVGGGAVGVVQGGVGVRALGEQERLDLGQAEGDGVAGSAAGDQGRGRR